MRFRSLSLLLCLLLTWPVGPASATRTASTHRRAALAARFIISAQQADGSIPVLSSIGGTADAVVALSAVRRGPLAIERALDYLESQTSQIDELGETAKVVAAVSAGGRDPRDFEGRDLVAEIESTQTITGRYGAATSVFSHSLAMLALESAGGSSSLAPAARWLAAAQCADGGWQFQEPATPIVEDEHCAAGPVDIDVSNPDTTALAVQALEGGSIPISPSADPFAFFEAARDTNKGGWGYGGIGFGSVTNANSTGMVLQAYAAADRPSPRGAMAALIALQDVLCGPMGGAFYYSWADEDGDGSHERTMPGDLSATVAATPALIMASLPVFPGRAEAVPRSPRCPA